MAESGPVQLIADEQLRLAREFENMALEVWTAPSRCTGWNNAMVVGHLVFYANEYREAITRAVRGDSAAPHGPDGRPLTPAEFLSDAQVRQDVLARQAPDELLRQFASSGEALMAVLGNLTSADMALPVWHYSGVLTSAVLLAYRVYELGFHGWDVRASVDREARIHLELCPFLVGAVRQLLPMFCQPERSIDVTCTFEVDDQTWTTRICDGKLAETSASAADATIRMDSCTLLLLTTGRQTLVDCADQVVIEGAQDRAEQLLAASCFRI